MKIYTAEYDANRPSTKSVEVPLNSNFGIAVGVKYNGEDAEIKQGSLTLNEQPEDDVYANMAIFNLSSDGETGMEKYTVDFGINTPLPKIESPEGWTNGTPVQGEIDKELWGKTIACASRARTDVSDVDFPFLPVRVNDSGDVAYAYAQGFITSPDLQTTYARITMRNNGYVYMLQVLNPSTGSFTTVDTFVVPENSIWYCTGATAGEGTAVKLYCNPGLIVRTSRQFGLYIKKTDKGEVEGYGENYVFKNTITLSGTNEDDSEFSYELPTTN